jgi:hypothetical protein
VLKGIGFAPSYPRTDRQTHPLPWKWKEEKRDFDLFILKIFKKKLKNFYLFFYFELIFLVFLNYFNALILKLIFKN